MTLFLAFESLRRGQGGVARVARLTMKAIQEARPDLRIQALTLRDVDDPIPQVETAKGSRWAFVRNVWRASLRSSHFIYDFLGMARAHPWLPGLRRPYLSWIHGIEVWDRSRGDRVRAARRASTLVSNSHYTRDRAQRIHGGFSRARVCWLATEEDTGPPGRPTQPNRPTVLTLGRMDTDGYKGHEELIRTWPQVLREVPDAELLIVGGGPDRPRLENLAQECSRAGRIRFEGFVPEDRMADVWSRACVFAMPSRGEGFGLVYVEAMRQGLPVVASAHDAGPEVNIDGTTGFNVNLDSPEELPRRLVQLLRDPAEARALGEAGRRRWIEHFRFSRFKERFVPILDEFLGL